MTLVGPRTIPVCTHFSVADDLLTVSLDSNGHEVLAYCGWYFHVSLLVLMTSIILVSTK